MFRLIDTADCNIDNCLVISFLQIMRVKSVINVWYISLIASGGSLSYILLNFPFLISVHKRKYKMRAAVVFFCVLITNSPPPPLIEQICSTSVLAEVAQFPILLTRLCYNTSLPPVPPAMIEIYVLCKQQYVLCRNYH